MASLTGMLPQTSDVVVIGGGIAGVMTAYQLARKGVSVTLCEKGHIGGEQSSRNWGWVRVQGRDPREVPIAVHAMALWRQLAAELGAETLGFKQGGATYLTDKPSVLEGFSDWIKTTAPMRPDDVESHLIEPNDVRRLLQTDDISWVGGMKTPSDCRAEPRLAVPAFARAARSAGAHIIEQCAVRGLETEAGNISSVVTERGTIKTSSVVLAGGAWSGVFCRSLGIRLPQLKVLASVCRTEPAPLVTESSVYTAKAAFRRRQDGGYTIAAGHSEVFPVVPDGLRYLSDFWSLVRAEVFTGAIRPRLDHRFFQELSRPAHWSLDGISPFEKTRTLNPHPVERYLRRGVRDVEKLSPAFGKLRIAESWAGMIDVTPDVLPVLDSIAGLPGFYLATGFSGHGFGLGPATGHVMADLVTGETPAVDLKPFRFSRFEEGDTNEIHAHL